MNELSHEVVKKWIKTDQVSLNDVWEMVGFSTKGNAKKRLLEELENGIDFNVINMEKVQLEGNRRVSRPYSDIIMTKEAFKIFAASAHTESGKAVRRYLVKFEASQKIELKSPALLIAEALVLADSTIKRQALQIEEMTPKAEFFDITQQSGKEFSISAVAKIIGEGPRKLFAKLRSMKILMHDNTPYQRFIDADQFRLVQTGTYQVNDEIRIGTKTVMTQKGIDYLVKRLNKALS